MHKHTRWVSGGWRVGAVIAAAAALWTAGAAYAADAATPSGLPVPRFASLKYATVNGRAGPSAQHRVLWRYHQKGLPVEIVAETDDWRRVRDPAGDLIWVHKRVLEGRRMVFIAGETALKSRPDAGAGTRAMADAGVVMALDLCRRNWCRVRAQGIDGWAARETLWGVYPEETDG